MPFQPIDPGPGSYYPKAKRPKNNYSMRPKTAVDSKNYSLSYNL